MFELVHLVTSVEDFGFSLYLSIMGLLVWALACGVWGPKFKSQSWAFFSRGGKISKKNPWKFVDLFLLTLKWYMTFTPAHQLCIKKSTQISDSEWNLRKREKKIRRTDQKHQLEKCVNTCLKSCIKRQATCPIHPDTVLLHVDLGVVRKKPHE